MIISVSDFNNFYVSDFNNDDHGKYKLFNGHITGCMSKNAVGI
ncbi:hypothetical protein MgSA37_03124 [Mucilaginibacter gotjawali]|uniref:Uncharacterized protein n=2 Tax=Mucilaginibacter gotjawali TaxID=1550579 RepID=A0A0X8X3D2_9SPHI|nr:hypothetical protein [Mucilaginibacter gotjawali]BAU54944.1 hypothetical protein MgSA37_03124 [Mucilaginibacter gotjawali]